MELTAQQYEKISHCFPKQRGNVHNSNLKVINAILYVMENGCKWRGLPKYFGNWHTIYTRWNRWSKNGVLDKVFLLLQQLQYIKLEVRVLSLDSTCVKVHPDGMGALKKTAPNVSASPEEDGQQRFIWLPRMTQQL
jgi:transposase